MQPGGLILLDDLTPAERWPEEWRGKPDPRLAAAELWTAPESAVILASRLA